MRGDCLLQFPARLTRNQHMQWDKHKHDWPHADHSHFVDSRPHRWHIQQMGQGPTLLLIHGAGGATHSWRDMMPILAKTHHVVAIDLPGQGFSQLGTRQRCSLTPMAEDIQALCSDQGWQPAAIIGHSAGGAIALQMCLLGVDAKVICFNAALGNFKGLAGFLFPMIAKMLALNPFTASMFSLGASNASSVKRLIEGTGSYLTDEGLGYYQNLIGDRDHVDATLLMMAQWSLDGLRNRFGEIDSDVLLIAADNDRAVPPETSDDAARLLPNAKVTRVPNLGHLAHEEDPDAMTALVLDHIGAHK